MHKGHLDQQRANQHSTQPPPAEILTDGPTEAHEAHEALDDTFPPEPPARQSHYIYADCQANTVMV
jgi:hypothetical protein